MRRIPLCLASLLGALALPSAGAQTQIIGFEGLPRGQVPQGYEDLSWSTAQGLFFHGWYVVAEGDAQWRPSSGEQNVRSDESELIYFYRPGEPFTFNSLYLSLFCRSEWCTHRDVYISASLNGKGVYGATITIDPSAMTKYTFDWENVDKVTFHTLGPQILIDDMMITTTPEPATLLLVGSGLAGMVIARRRRGLHRA